MTESSQWLQALCAQINNLCLIRSGVLFENKFFINPFFLNLITCDGHHNPSTRTILESTYINKVYKISSVISKSFSNQLHPGSISLGSICLGCCFNFCLLWPGMENSVLPEMFTVVARDLGERISFRKKDLESWIFSAFLYDSQYSLISTNLNSSHWDISGNHYSSDWVFSMTSGLGKEIQTSIDENTTFNIIALGKYTSETNLRDLIALDFLNSAFPYFPLVFSILLKGKRRIKKYLLNSSYA